jgi:cold shock CspA family protein
MVAAPMFLCMSTTSEAAGMKILVAGQLVAYEVGPARDGRSKAVNLRLLER